MSEPLVTTTLSALSDERITSPVRRSMLRSMSVIRRPTLDPLVTSRLSSLGSLSWQLYAWCVWPVITASMRGLRPLLMSTIGPEMPGQELYAVGSLGKPPSCTSTTIDLTPCRWSLLAAALAVSTSSVKRSPWTPDLVTMFGVFSSVMPMNPTFTPPYFLTVTPGKTVLPVSSWKTLADR